MAQNHHQGLWFTHCHSDRKKAVLIKTHLLTLSSRILEQRTLSSCLMLSFFKGQLELNTRNVLLKTQKLKKNQKAGIHILDRPKFLFNQHINYLLFFNVCGMLYIKTVCKHMQNSEDFSACKKNKEFFHRSKAEGVKKFL